MDALSGAADSGRRSFAVDLDVFSGPFSVLLSLIARKRLDITEVALAEVTDEFVAFARAQEEFDLSQASEFLVVAATLLDMKAARLLPRQETEDEDLEFLEQRDLLFAKLLQYRAFKEAAEDMARRLARQALAHGRSVVLEEPYATAVPEVRITADATELAILAAAALTRSRAGEPEVDTGHLHEALVPVAGQIAVLRRALVGAGRVTFASLCGSALGTPTVVARFLAVLELLRRREIAVEQGEPLGSLIIVSTPRAGAGGPAGDGQDDGGGHG
ncbi:MAG: ScpA family protein [Actinomycetaceae bacterium]|nr:ScpA family protein [Actinomycetaceae bacterium]